MTAHREPRHCDPLLVSLTTITTFIPRTARTDAYLQCQQEFLSYFSGHHPDIDKIKLL